jgi:hypothetical protein
MQYTTMSNANNPGSARVSRADFGVSPKQSFLFLVCKIKDGDCRTGREQHPAFCANADTVAAVNAYRSGF